MGWRPEEPYNTLPPLPPAAALETVPVLKTTIAARSALAALDQAAQLLPKPEVLLNTAVILEAQASSEIENIVTTADALFQQLRAAGQPHDHATKEALRYRTALFAGVAAIRKRPLTARTAETVCSKIMNREMAIRRLPGTRIANPVSGQIIYSPPEGAELIAGMLKNWESFVHATDDLDPLVRMALAHYQFEAIHPFHDGNGRTGRILNILMLIQGGLVSEPILYLSRYVIRHKSDYYRLLLDITRNGSTGWEPWIIFMLEAVKQTAESTLSKIAAIRSVQAELYDAARAASMGGRDAEFLALLFEQPYVRITDVVERCGVARQTAGGWLTDLVNAGILTDFRLGRERLFVNNRFRHVLTRDELDT